MKKRLSSSLSKRETGNFFSAQLRFLKFLFTMYRWYVIFLVMAQPKANKLELWVRARTSDQKEQRRQEILEAAYKLFHDLGYEQASLNRMAREARLSKTSICLYFQTREEVFMEIFFKTFRDWFGKTIAAIEALDDCASVRDVAEAWMDVSWHHERLRAIAPLVAISIEYNVSDGCLAACLRLKQAECERLRQVLNRFVAVDQSQMWDLFLFAFSLYSQFVGYEKNKGFDVAMKHPDLTWMKRDYRSMLANLLTLFLEDLKFNKNGKNRE